LPAGIISPAGADAESLSSDGDPPHADATSEQAKAHIIISQRIVEHLPVCDCR
jgi:hypothetical protein